MWTEHGMPIYKNTSQNYSTRIFIFKKHFFYITEFKGILLNRHDPYNCISILQHYKCSGFKGWLFGLCEGRVNTSGFTLLCHSQIGVTHLYLSACWFTAICLTMSQWRIVKPSAMTAMPSIALYLISPLSPLLFSQHN